MNYLQRQNTQAEKAILAQEYMQSPAGGYEAGLEYQNAIAQTELVHTWVGSRDSRTWFADLMGILVTDGVYFYHAPAPQQARTNLSVHTYAGEQKTVSVGDMVELIKDVFGLTVVQISDIIGISRPAIYNHLSGDVPADTTAYEALYAAAQRVREVVNVPLKPGLKSVLVDGKTLLRHLKDSFRDPRAIEEVAVSVAEKLTQSYPGSKERTVSQQRRSIATVGKSG